MRLTTFESQDQLIALLDQASAGLANCRKAMSVVDPTGQDGLENVRVAVERAKPYIMAFKKHERTALDLILGCSH